MNQKLECAIHRERGIRVFRDVRIEQGIAGSLFENGRQICFGCGGKGGGHTRSNGIQHCCLHHGGFIASALEHKAIDAAEGQAIGFNNRFFQRNMMDVRGIELQRVKDGRKVNRKLRLRRVWAAEQRALEGKGRILDRVFNVVFIRCTTPKEQ